MGTGSALINGLLLGKVAFLKAAILANLLLGSNSADELADDASYVAPADDYGVPYEPPANSLLICNVVVNAVPSCHVYSKGPRSCHPWWGRRGCQIFVSICVPALIKLFAVVLAK